MKRFFPRLDVGKGSTPTIPHVVFYHCSTSKVYVVMFWEGVDKGTKQLLLFIFGLFYVIFCLFISPLSTPENCHAPFVKYPLGCLELIGSEDTDVIDILSLSLLFLHIFLSVYEALSILPTPMPDKMYGPFDGYHPT